MTIRKKPTEKLLYVREILRRFPSISTRAAARIAFKERPDLYYRVQSAYLRVQYARGLQGARHRNNVLDKSQFTASSKTLLLTESLT